MKSAFILECCECGVKFIAFDCFCWVTDCPTCGAIASVWTSEHLGDDFEGLLEVKR